MSLPDYLDGAVDLHVHSSPDVDPRRYDDIELAREAAKAGMGAILIKSHQASTVERAYLVSRVVSGIDVYGGVVLNETVGGLNPSAARLAIQLGAKQIWMPTRSAANHRRHHGESGGITILDAVGDLCQPAREIVTLVAAADCALGTGHLSPEEVFVLAEAAQAAGISKLLITHPEWFGTRYSLEEQKQLATRGNVMFERCFVSTTHRCGFTPLSVIENAISEIGVNSTVLSTDLGQPDTPTPVEGLRTFTAQLRASGFSADEIYRMTNTNPRAILTSTAELRITAARVAQE